MLEKLREGTEQSAKATEGRNVTDIQSPPGCGPEHSSALVSKENSQKLVQVLMAAVWRGAEGGQSEREKEVYAQSGVAR